MLSSQTLGLNRFVALLFGCLGLLLFLTPAWASEHFAWKASPMVVMTMGGWYLGNAFMAWEAGKARPWAVNKGCQIVIWAFSAMEAGLLLVHRGVLRLDSPLAKGYVLVLVAAAVCALVGMVDYGRARPAAAVEPGPVPFWWPLMAIFFVVYVSALAYLLSDGIAPDGKVWPGEMSLLTARGFGAFYFSLVLGMLPLVRTRTMAPVLPYMRAGLALVVAITAAAFLRLGEFDFAAHPGQWLYIGSYLAACIGALIVLGWERLRPA
jgi:hypothetical protein